MVKSEFLKMMVQDNETRTNKKGLFSEVIDCMEIALSQTPDSAEIDSSKNVEEAYKLIEKEGKNSPDHCCGPFKAAEILADYLGVKYVRASKKYSNGGEIVSLEDFL